MLGIQEAVYHGVPMLGLPFGNDQRGNVAKLRKEGFALVLGWDNVNEEVLHDAINTLLNDPR
jgi:glucuronosyltransferase